MDLNTLWFLLVAVLFTGFFVLEGFDYGVGVLLPFVAKTDEERRRVINAIGPVWDGNEVWILTGGGAIFAAFPHWYATLFSGFYLALFVILVALIVRGVAFEFRSKHTSRAWRSGWDRAIFVGSLLPAILWGTALANLLKGVPIDQTKTYTGSFFDLLSPYTLLAGLATLALFVTHGAIFLNLKSSEPIRGRSVRLVKMVGPVATVLVLLFAAGTYVWTDVYTRLGLNPGLVPLLALGALLSAGGLIHRERMGWAFVMTTLTIVFTVSTLFVALYPRVMVSSLDPGWSLTVYNSASTPHTLAIMGVVAAIFVPLVLLYQGWTYWVFRHRIGAETKLEY
jgi:cytochrome bd ubiquinol oxidase subunit II